MSIEYIRTKFMQWGRMCLMASGVTNDTITQTDLKKLFLKKKAKRKQARKAKRAEMMAEKMGEKRKRVMKKKKRRNKVKGSNNF